MVIIPTGKIFNFKNSMDFINNQPKLFKLSCQEIEKKFGRSNFDVAEEYVWDLIYHHFGNSADFVINNSYFDDNHNNPHFHTLNFEIEGIDDTTAELVYQELVQKGLIIT